MERYDNYKDSGVDWIGQIPEHWELMHLRNFIWELLFIKIKKLKFSLVITKVMSK